MNEVISAMRVEYRKKSLRKSDVSGHPIDQFESWFNEAVSAEVPEPNAMTLSTVNGAGQPSGRIVLLKDVNHDGFSFYTNYASRKGEELRANPKAALTFFWGELERQVRIEGSVEFVSPEVATAYFKSRPIGSQIGAITSPQSQPIANREWLEERLVEVTKEVGESGAERPKHWGGYLLKPTYVEFWQGRPSRLHDRIAYSFENGQWEIERLAP